MGVQIPVGYGQWWLPVTLAGDPDAMIFTCGFQDLDTQSADALAESITAQLFGRPSFAASTIWQDYTLGPGRVTVNRLFGTFEGFGTGVRAGTNTTQPPLPQNNAVLCHKITQRGGRRGRGRMYIPPFMVSEANVTATGVIAAATVSSLQTDLNTWRANCSSVVGTPLQLLHQPPEVGPAVPPDAINTFLVSNVIATQRTRLRR